MYTQTHLHKHAHKNTHTQTHTQTQNETGLYAVHRQYTQPIIMREGTQTQTFGHA